MLMFTFFDMRFCFKNFHKGNLNETEERTLQPRLSSNDEFIIINSRISQIVTWNSGETDFHKLKLLPHFEYKFHKKCI